MNPADWELDVHYPEDFGEPTFPADKNMPISMARREGTLIGFLHPSQGNLWKLLYNTMNPTIQLYWKYAHEHSDKNSLTTEDYYSWEKFTEDFNNLDLREVPWIPLWTMIPDSHTFL